MPATSPSRRPTRAGSLAGLLALLPGLALAQPGFPAQAPQPPQAASPPGIVKHWSEPETGIDCTPGDTRPACGAAARTLHPTPRPTSLARRPSSQSRQHAAPAMVIQPPPRTSDIRGNKLVPPGITAFLNDPRIDPQTRGFLFYIASKPVSDWTLQELTLVTQLVPTLTEIAIPTRTLSEFYKFLGLDPTQLFAPQLAQNWQSQSTSFDARNLSSTEQGFCLQALGLGSNLDSESVTLGQVAACTGNAGEP